jgi:hypothetical protein
MEHFILHFLTGTMAFRGSQPPPMRKGAGIPDAFLENSNPERIHSQEKLQKVQRMQVICRMLPKKRTTYHLAPRVGAKIRRGETDWGTAR